MQPNASAAGVLPEAPVGFSKSLPEETRTHFLGNPLLPTANMVLSFPFTPHLSRGMSSDSIITHGFAGLAD